MLAGGKRIGSGRKSKYNVSEKERIIEICEKVWECRNYNTDHILVDIYGDRPEIKKIKIWNAFVEKKTATSSSIGKATIPKSSVNKLLETDPNYSFEYKLFHKPQIRVELLNLSVLIIALIFPDRYHRVNTIDKIWKYKNIPK